MSEKVIIFGTDSCPYTISARRVYAKKGYEVEYINVQSDPEELTRMLDHSNGRREIPVILIDDEVTIGCGGT